ncbi:LysR family transcriptional regulator [Variovorax sp. YR216]|uniref:LysR family transcriptional regulator n=1 Tax=Variovorax sp. YR216 TaxID=1882828 RepID=UPI0008971334|nr:LysR family transcriptional regulator [Variovorax sp. YR216]SEB19356.1 DNA-binding transcriptional regulator, LysR family [Variovorax sp. YR216]
MDKFQEMRVFSAVVEAGSFVSAAGALSISKAAVSRYVADLEQRLGVRLLHRTTRRLSLTGEGEVFHSRCREILSSIEESEAEVSTRAGSASGLLKVSVPLSFGVKHLARLWVGFMAAHPQVSLDVNLSDRVVDLVDEGFDLAIRIARLPDSSLISREIATTRLVLCASPHYLKRRGTPLKPSDLRAHDVIAYTLLAMGDQWSFEGPDGAVTVKVVPRLRSNNGDTCIVAALNGAGVILQPTFLVEEHLAAGTLVELLPGFRSIELGIFAVYPTRKFVVPKVRLFIDYLAKSLAGAAWGVRG